MIWFIPGIIIGIMITYGVNLYIKKKSLAQMTQTEANKRPFQLVEDTKDYVYYFEMKPKWRFTYIYPPFEKIFGEEQGKLVYDQPQIMLDRVHPDDQDMLMNKINGQMDYSKPCVYRIMNNDGDYLTFEEYTTPVYKDGELVAIQGILRNITWKLKLQEDLEYKSTHDSLTKVFNRQVFEELMDRYNQLENVPIGIVVCDLDELKYINDNLGHKQGDFLIKNVANILNSYSDKNVIVSRIGGDEFAILITNMTKPSVETLVEKIEREIAIYNEGYYEIRIQMSIGYSYSKWSIGKMERLFEYADKSMYENKERRKSERSG